MRNIGFALSQKMLPLCIFLCRYLILIFISNSGDPALEPLVISGDKVISVGRDHIMTPQALANLFCNQLHRLKTTYIDTSSG